MKKLLSLLVLGYVFLPLVSFAGLVIAPPTAGVKTTISACEVGPHFDSTGELVAGTNCTTLNVTVTQDFQYVTAEGNLYRSDCQEPPPSSGLSITPAACNYVPNGKMDPQTGNGTTEPSRGLVPCGGGGQQPCQTCNVIDLTNNVIGWLVMVLGTIAAIIIVYAGIKLVTSGGNQHAMEEAKSMMTNILIGYIIILSGWLIIDYGMKALLAPDSKFGVWNAIECVAQPVPDAYKAWSNPDKTLQGVLGWVASQDSAGAMIAACDLLPGPPGAMEHDCTKQKATCVGNLGRAVVNAEGTAVTCLGASYTATRDAGGGGQQCDPGNIACSVPALQEVGMSAMQANVMSCIALTESSGNPATPPYNQAHPGSNSSACGTFQVVRTTWVGAATGECSDFSQCTNALCNAKVTATLVGQSGYSSWTCSGCNLKAANCVAVYGH